MNLSSSSQMTEMVETPKEWKLSSLGSIAEIHDKKRIPLSKMERSKRQGIYPYCGANGIIDYIDDYIFNGEYVLIAEDGGFWSKFDNTAYLMKGKFWVNNHAHIVRAIKDKTINKYLLYWFIYENIEKYTSGSTRKKLTQSVLKKINIPLPPLSEQKNIAYILSTVQEAIEKTTTVIQATKELKKSMMKHLFTYGPVPITEREKVQLKETEIGEIPEKWEIVKLGDICNFITGKLNSNQAVEDGKYPFFTCSQETFKINQYSFDCEAVLLAGNNARGIYSAKYYNGKFDAYQRTYVITIKDTNFITYRFLHRSLETKLKVLRLQSIGTTTKFLTVKLLKNLEIPLPSLEEQKKIIEISSSIAIKTNSEELEEQILKDVFNSFLENLMTGRIRVKDLNLNNLQSMELEL